MTPKALIDSYPAFNFGDYLPLHRCGVPRGYVAVLATDRKVVDGSTAVFVYQDRVVIMALRIPYNHNDWFTVSSEHYDTLDELRTAIDAAIARPTASCWGA